MAERGQGPMLPVAVVSDCRLFLECLGQALACASAIDPGFDVAPTDSAHNGIVLLDAALEGALERCAALTRAGKAVILINLGRDDCAVTALRAGARGVLERQAGMEQLRTAIRMVGEGQVSAPQGAVARALSLLSTMAGASPDESAERRLTRREKEIMGHTVGGLSNKEIADRMAIRTSTVKAHLTSVFRKLSVRDRTQLVVLYHHADPRSPASVWVAGRGSYLRA